MESPLRTYEPENTCVILSEDTMKVESLGDGEIKHVELRFIQPDYDKMDFSDEFLEEVKSKRRCLLDALEYIDKNPSWVRTLESLKIVNLNPSKVHASVLWFGEFYSSNIHRNLKQLDASGVTPEIDKGFKRLETLRVSDINALNLIHAQYSNSVRTLIISNIDKLGVRHEVNTINGATCFDSAIDQIYFETYTKDEDCPQKTDEWRQMVYRFASHFKKLKDPRVREIKCHC